MIIVPEGMMMIKMLTLFRKKCKGGVDPDNPTTYARVFLAKHAKVNIVQYGLTLYTLRQRDRETDHKHL